MKNIGILLILASFYTSSVAQTTFGDTTKTEVVVSTVYKPDVAESIKIDIQPALEDPKVSPPTYTYRFANIAYKPKAVYSPIDPVFVKAEKLPDLFDNYIEIGGGNYATSYVDANIFNTRDKYYTYGLRLKHHAASLSKNPNQALFSQNGVTAYGKREKGGRLEGKIDYQRNVVHFYGATDTFERSLNDINQIYNDISANAIFSTRPTGKVVSDLDIGFNIFDKLGENENTIRVGNNNEFKIGKGRLHLENEIVYNMLTEFAEYNRLFINVEPFYAFRAKKWDLELGLNVNYLNDSNTSIPYVSPHLLAETYLVPDKLRFFLEVDGGVQQNTLKNLSYENFFLSNQITEFRNPVEAINWHAGMNGSFKRFVEYGIILGQRIVKDQYLFVSDTNALNTMNVVYDDVSRFEFAGELKFDVNSNLDIGFRGNFYSYNLATEKEAWHMPTYDVSTFATVRISDKIYINGGYYGTSARKARDLKNNVFTLNAINDVNIGAEYRYRKNISGFINVNNILNQKYQNWNYYRAQGINVLAGVTFSL